MNTDDESKFDTELSLERIEELVDIGDHFGLLIKDKCLQEIIKPYPEVYFQASELFIRSMLVRLTERKYDIETALVMAIAWGVYVAELKQTRLLEVGQLTTLH